MAILAMIAEHITKDQKEQDKKNTFKQALINNWRASSIQRFPQ